MTLAILLMRSWGNIIVAMAAELKWDQAFAEATAIGAVLPIEACVPKWTKAKIYTLLQGFTLL